jgi:radical SAM-linked protein
MMIFISHLDTQRLFHRLMKRLDVKLKYSNGFNPHPRLSFAQPLSVGHSSAAEYLEFETTEPIKFQTFKESFNAVAPEGIRLLESWSLRDGGKAVAAVAAAARYRLEIPFFFPCMEATLDFFASEAIFAEKRSKKTKSVEKVNIRPHIVALKPLLVSDGDVVLLSVLHANLNPEVMLRSFYKFCGKAYERESIRIERTSVLGWRGDELVPLESICLE